MWTLLVEVAVVDAEDVLELTATEDQKPVETLVGFANSITVHLKGNPGWNRPSEHGGTESRREDRMDLFQAAAGDEERVKAAERLFDHPVALEAARRFLQNDANHLVIAYVDGQAAGFVSGTELTHPDQSQPELFLNELGVDAAYRGRGIGSALVSALWELAQSRGCRGMWVLTDEANAAAKKVYGGTDGIRQADQVMFQWGDT
jgi:ribosomal protein S18 acetylase RimI-like enzyme